MKKSSTSDVADFSSWRVRWINYHVRDVTLSNNEWNIVIAAEWSAGSRNFYRRVREQKQNVAASKLNSIFRRKYVYHLSNCLNDYFITIFQMQRIIDMIRQRWKFKLARRRYRTVSFKYCRTIFEIIFLSSWNRRHAFTDFGKILRQSCRSSIYERNGGDEWLRNGKR